MRYNKVIVIVIVITNLLSIIFQKSCPWFQPTEIRGRITILSPYSPFLGCFHFMFVVFTVCTTFRQLFTNFFFLETAFTPIQKWIPDSKFWWIPDSRSMWIPDSSPLDS